MIDHVAVCVTKIDSEQLDNFMGALGFWQFVIPRDAPQYAYELEQTQCWYADGGDCDVHVVENAEEVTDWGWGHICVVASTQVQYEELSASGWCTRDNGTGRIWLEGPGRIRVEVRAP